MKRLIIVFAAVIAAFALTSCNQCTKSDATVPSIKFNVEGILQGQGHVVVGFPTGEFEATGDAAISARSANDTLVAVPNGSQNFRSVLENPGEFNSETVQFAENLSSAVYVKVLEGEWHGSLKGYAKWGDIYLIIDEEFPKSDTTAVVQ